jgi:hypothetical protein
LESKGRAKGGQREGKAKEDLTKNKRTKTALKVLRDSEELILIGLKKPKNFRTLVFIAKVRATTNRTIQSY